MKESQNDSDRVAGWAAGRWTGRARTEDGRELDDGRRRLPAARTTGSRSAGDEG
ncbi:MAG: hypothetical protein GY737_08155 [Desulfobacteraceae bacterium]|nr:hypothetical protein [Desulfobacteraceae bacterium]